MAQFYVAGNELSGWAAWALALIFLVPFVPLAWGVVETWRRRRRVAARFRDYARDKGLSPAQSRLLLQVARRVGAGDPVEVLRSAARFDRCVHGNGRLVDRKTGQELARVRAALGFDRLLPGDRLRSTRQLGRGHHLLLRRAGEDAAAGSPCVVETQDDHALVATPLLADSHEGVDSWQLGSRVEAQFRQGRGTTYGFVTDVLGAEPGPQRLLLRHTQQVARVQFRTFFRLRTQFPIVFLIGEGAAGADREQAGRLEGTVLDISGGGLSVRVAEAVPENTHVTVDPGFAGPYALAGVRCQVVATLRREEAVHLRVKYVELPAESETAIVRGIYQRQLGLSRTQPGSARGTAAGDRPRTPRRAAAGARGRRRMRPSGMAT